MERKTYKWTIEIEVSENWVQDGFDISDYSPYDLACALQEGILSVAYPGDELKAKVIKSPDAAAISAEQGFEPHQVLTK